MPMKRFFPRLLLNSQRLGVTLGLAAVFSIVLFYIVPEIVSVLLAGALLAAMLAIQERRQLRFFRGFILPALLIWLSSFAFFLAKSHHSDDMAIVFGALALLIAALIFGFYRIATISTQSDERTLEKPPAL